MTPVKTAATAVPLHPLLAERWSPRGLDASHELGDGQLTALLEAARWAPSASNTQPWRFLVAERGTEAFDALFSTLAPGNRQWAGAASVLVLAAAQTHQPDGVPQPWAMYDIGQAVAHLNVQAQHEGIAVHQLGGFDTAVAAAALRLPVGLQPVVVLAIGRHDETALLPEPLATRESAPRERLPLDALLLPTPGELLRTRPVAA
jgi:nitroreductase